MKMQMTIQETTVVCSCCGNAVHTIWAFEQELVVGHFTDGHQVRGKQDFAYCNTRHGDFCYGGYSNAGLHKKQGE